MEEKITKLWPELIFHSEEIGKSWLVQIRKSVWLAVDFDLRKICIAHGKEGDDFIYYIDFPKSRDFTKKRFIRIYNSVTGNNFDEHEKLAQIPDDLKKRLSDIYYALSGEKVNNENVKDCFNQQKMYDIYQVLFQSDQLLGWRNGKKY